VLWTPAEQRQKNANALRAIAVFTQLGRLSNREVTHSNWEVEGSGLPRVGSDTRPEVNDRSHKELIQKLVQCSKTGERGLSAWARPGSNNLKKWKDLRPLLNW